MRIKIKKIGAILFLLALCTATYAQLPSKIKLDQYLDRLNEKSKAMGSLTIAKDGKELYSKSIGYGQINGAEKKPLIAETKYRIGSVTKMFTAVLIFQLIEEGKLKLTDPLQKFFPQVQNSAKITIEQLLAHRAGIHEVTADPNFRTIRTKEITKDEMLANIAKSTPDFEPGTKYSYSSAGYFLLGYIVEKLTGKTYQEALKTRISAKIGLKNTYQAVENINATKNESFSYKYGKDWEQQIETHPSILFGAGSLVSTSADLAKFIQSLFNLKLISTANLTLMMQQKLGMDTFTYHGKTGYGHTGGVDGFGSWLVYIPAEKLAVSYATNGKVYAVSDIIDGIFAIYWDKPFTIPTFESLTVSEELLDKYVGIYVFPGAPLKFTVTKENDKLFVQLTGQSIIPLEPISAYKFKIESPPIEFEFNVEKKQMTIRRNGNERIFTKEIN